MDQKKLSETWRKGYGFLDSVQQIKLLNKSKTLRIQMNCQNTLQINQTSMDNKQLSKIYWTERCFSYLRITESQPRESQSNKEEIPHNKEETSEGSDVGEVVFEVEEEEDAYQGEREAENNEDRENDMKCVLVIDAVSIHMYVLIKTELCTCLLKED